MGTEPVDGPPRASSGRRTLLLSLLLGLAFAVGALAVGGVLTAQDRRPDEGSSPGLGPVSGPAAMPLPDVELEAFAEGGGTIKGSDFRGTPLVVNFWATWCAPCVAEMPELEEVATELEERVAFLGVNYRDPDRAAARAFVEELGISYPLVVDPAGEFLAAVDGVVMPTTLFVDAEGTIVYRHAGALDDRELRDLLREQLGVGA